ncbi:YbfB/YjiJ family MFS transporter [Pigmentiphaga aceris]|uniref:YbfB/YjiJ family MFS transporter n=1 Tax=Pigmentiphaga aceris TaxID=1940612 RepID=A0A5C0AR67_9BURK|nr:YbfB/YjiJ family MFS transporter [Pigmentiphaga aceris]QEI04568.1 YbfB/YjiJ family MFS transporter [Pigmentiphaga aceris]
MAPRSVPSARPVHAARSIPATARVPLAARELVAAAIVLAVGMGFGRFAYTGVYPLMVRDGIFTLTTGSWAASANYAGYLLGAILVARAGPAQATAMCRLALAGTVLGLLAMALSASPSVLIGVRFLAGAVSAIALVGVSTWLFQVLDYMAGAPYMFAGVGVGIVVSAELIAVGNLAGWHSQRMWLVLGMAACVLAAVAWRWVGRNTPVASETTKAASAATVARSPSIDAWPLLIVYTLAGFGYIVTATYLPLFTRQALGNIDPIHVWAVFGLGAAPSCLLWHAIHQRVGTRMALGANLGLQLLGVLLPVLSHTPAAFLASAILVGGTFMGTITIAMPAARLAAQQVRFNIMAALVIGYGTGQILGPLVSDLLHARFGGFDAPLWTAGGVLGVAVLGCAYPSTGSAKPPAASA